MSQAARRENLERLALWGGILVGPLAWSVALGANLPLVWSACYERSRGPLLAVSFASLLVTLAAALLAWRHLAPHPSEAVREARAEFMARLGLGLSSLFALLIAASAVPIFLLDACPR